MTQLCEIDSSGQLGSTRWAHLHNCMRTDADTTQIQPQGDADQDIARRLVLQRVLLDLTRSDLSDLDPALENIAKAAAEAIEVERVSIWFFEDSMQSILCRCLYTRSSNTFEIGDSLSAQDYPGYFRALAEARTIAAIDAATDPRTSEFARDYLPSKNIASMLDVPVRSESELVGIVCCEEVGIRHEWSVEEIEFAASIADFVALAMETSRRKRAEASLRAANETLERRVQMRTKELEAANAELEAFSYSVSHDLRQPLRVIEGFASLLREDSAANELPNLEHNLGIIIRNAQTMSELMDGYLTFSRLGRSEARSEQINLAELALEVIESVKLDSRAANASFTVTDGFPPVTGDPSLLRQLLANLIFNAVKFAQAQPAVNVEVGSRVGDNGQAVFFVRDDGPGFGDQDPQGLFNLFQRLPTATGVDGTGLGLAIARRIVERHGGRIWAAPSAGVGACFEFTLPKGDGA